MGTVYAESAPDLANHACACSDLRRAKSIALLPCEVIMY